MTVAGAALDSTLAAQLGATAARLLALDPALLGGVVLRGPHGPARTAWLDALRALLPAGAPLVRIPASVTDDRLQGGLDLAATLAAGRPIAEPGLLAAADGGIAVLAMAERAAPSVSGAIAAALDVGVVVLERDSLSTREPARFGVVLLDEHEGDDPGPATALLERCAIWLEIAWPATPLAVEPLPAGARERLAQVHLPDAAMRALVGAAAALGITSVRPAVQAARVARAIAALDGDMMVGDDAMAMAAQLVLAPRARMLPAPPPDAPLPEEPPSPPDSAEAEQDRADADDRPLEDQVLAAVQVALPPELLAMLTSGALPRRAGERGRRTQPQGRAAHGRTVGHRLGDPRRARLDVLATLRAAAPWQRVRGRDGARVALRRDDFRVRRLQQKIGTTVLFAVDASGSAAMARLAEAKGAVEMLLAESYARRDKVALVTFRGTAAELVVPPTRSLTRARRLLAGLPGGGGTPLASALDLLGATALHVRRGGGRPLAVLLTDGRANVNRAGQGGRPGAEADAEAAARRLAADRIDLLVLDTGTRPNPWLARLAERASARYLPLPDAQARTIGGAVRLATRP